MINLIMQANFQQKTQPFSTAKKRQESRVRMQEKLSYLTALDKQNSNLLTIK
jgi:hypothetical protein